MIGHAPGVSPMPDLGGVDTGGGGRADGSKGGLMLKVVMKGTT
jgi:hypothetical protein